MNAKAGSGARRCIVKCRRTLSTISACERMTTMPNRKNRPVALLDTDTARARWWVWYDCDARCPWRAPSGCRADALELQPSAAYGTNCRRRQLRRRKKEDTPNA